MVETISSLDEYLGAVGEAFRNVLEKLPISSDQNAKHGYEEYQLYLNGKY